jgi:diguanylate cyclase (GGDEF)-like protein
VSELRLSSSRATARVLVVGGLCADAAALADKLSERFGDSQVVRASTIESLEQARVHEFNLVLCFDHVEDGSVLQAVAAIQRQSNTVPIVLLLGIDNLDLLTDALRAGVADIVFRSPEYLEIVAYEVKKNLESESIRGENRRLHAALTSSLTELKRKNQELAESAFRLEALATTDTLTGLANRRNLTQKMQLLFAEAARYGHDMACLMLDLDGFKGINDTLGHPAGDEILTMVGRVLDEQIRVSDVGARYGGDEFVILLPHTSAQTAAELAHRIRISFQRHLRSIIPPNLRAGMSVGVSSLRLSGPISPAMLLQHADTALYAAKAVNSGGVMLCGEDLMPIRVNESMSA